jgi:hypothetical protein
MTYPASNRLPFLSRCRMRSAPLTLAALAWLLLVPSTTLFSAELSPSWKTRWEKTVEAAKKEGQISVYGSDTFELFLKSAFQKKYPEIKIGFVEVSGFSILRRSSEQISSRGFSARRI